jgi:hypothetical protein
VNSRVDPFRGRARGSANARGNPQRKPLRAFVATDTCAFLPFAQFCLSFCWERKSPCQEKPDKEVDPLRPLIVAIIALAVLVTIVSLWEIWHAEIAVP